jgi:pyrroloquinoline quinone biosynthesis protein B
MKDMRILILGSGQDAGIPQTGCYCNICKTARADANYRRLGPSIAIFDKWKGSCYLIDASPDLKYQLDKLHREINETKRRGRIPVSCILLTHAHPGHCCGLWHLGKVALNEKNLPVHCTPEMEQFLYENYPFSLLVKEKNIIIERVHPNEEIELNGLKCTPIRVPHRKEITDTVGYIIRSKKRVIYLPDVDRWTDSILKEIESSDIALIDGTFFSEMELPRFKEVPHPPIRETIELLDNTNTEVYFTHINHTNPVNRKGKEREYVERKGFKIAYDGMILET